MVTRWFLVGAALLACLLVVGCGVPQAEYDAAVADKDAAEARVASLQSDLSKATSRTSEAKNDLTLAQSELASAKSDLESAQSDLASAKSRASSAEGKVSSLQSRIPSLQSDIDTVQSDLEAAQAQITELESAEYVNEEYGFSVKYPSAWAENPDMERRNTVYNASETPYNIPGVSIGVNDIEEGVSFADELVADLEEGGSTEIEVVSERESTLADGTPASIVILQYTSADDYLIDALVLGVEKDGKRIYVLVYTVNIYAPFSEEQMSEVAHTLTFE